MVNALEILYALTALAFLAALVQLTRGQRTSARRFAIGGAVGAVAAIFFYWLLSTAT